MSQTAEQLSRSIVAAGLIAADELNALWAELPSGSRPKTGEAFLEWLIGKGLLTSFQGKQILAGRASGLVLGEYVVLSEIGAGGMGRVYKARHRRMDRIVALKMMSAAAMKDEAAVKRFQREARAAARLDHPNIVAAHDAGESGRAHFLVMQFVDGGNLSELVKKQGPLPVEKACDYVLQAARGLAYAHGEGIIHRDIKPANLLVDKKGIVKILDMGLARFEAGDNLTATEQVMGTVDYMSPEQAAETKSVDGRADIYSLGCTLWFLLTGKKLYEGETLVQRIMKHRDAPLPTLVTERPEAPEGLDHLLRRMIAKRPEDRFPSMDEAAAALAPFAAGAGSNSSVLAAGATMAGGSQVGGGSAVGRDAELQSFMNALAGGETPRPIVPPGVSVAGTPTVAGVPPYGSTSYGSTQLGARPAAGVPIARPATAGVAGANAAGPRRNTGRSRAPLWVCGIAAIGAIGAAAWALMRDGGPATGEPSPQTPAVAAAASPSGAMNSDPSNPSTGTADPSAISYLTPNASPTAPNVADATPGNARSSPPANPSSGAVASITPAVTPSVLSAPATPSVTAIPSTEPAVVADGVWTEFFRAGNLSGWRAMGTSGADYDVHVPRPGGWSVNGDVLRCDTGEPGWLCSGREYGDFEMELEFKANSTRSNSGIYLRSPTVGRLSRAGMEVQILGQGVLTGGITPYIDPKSVSVRAPGQWNAMRIRCVGPLVTVDLNGARVLDVDLDQDSALRSRPRRGYLGIANWQGLAAGMEFRNVRVRAPVAESTSAASTAAAPTGGTSSTATPSTAVAAAPATPPTDFKSWRGLAGYWTVQGTEVAGSNPNKAAATNTFFVSPDTYRDFELNCQVKLNEGNSGIQFRSAYTDPTQYTMRGPQADFGAGFWGSLWGEGGGGMMQAADPALVERIVKADDFNDVVLRCYGKHVTIRINGQTTVDGEFPALPDDGRIGIQLHQPNSGVVVRNLSIRRIRPDGSEFAPAGSPRATATAAEWTPIFTAAGDRQTFGAGTWTVNQGIVRSTGGDGWLGTNDFFDDFELALEFKLPPEGNTGIFLRAHSAGDVGGKDFLEIQLMDDLAAKHSGSPPINHTMAVVPHAAPREVVIASPNQWHEVHLKLVGTHLEGSFNGRPVLDVDLSKVAAPSAGLRSRSGRIGLQAKTPSAEFRNLRVRKLGAAASTPAAPAAKPAPSANPALRTTPGFTSLFNGRDLLGWSVSGGGTGNWIVENGAITCTGGGFNRLYTLRGDFRDVHVRAEVKINDGGNGGLHVRTPQGMGPGGYEAQVNSTSRTDPNRTGSLFATGAGVVYSFKQTVVPPDTWFVYEVIVRGNRIGILINGTAVADFTDTRNLFASGHIGLEHHDPQSRIYFRKVEVKELR